MAYSIGTISIQKNSSIITGSNTLFERVAKAQNGDLLYFRISEQDHILQVFDVNSDTQIKVSLLDGTPFNPASNANNIGYGLVQNFAATTPAKLAKGIAELQAKWHRRESELTGWFTSTDDTHPITNFLGEASAIPTPTKIAELAQVAMTASSDLATMAQEIASNQQSLASVAPRINAFNAVYPQVISANNNVITKHDEIVLAHNEVMAKASDVNAHAEQIAVHKQTVFELKQGVQQAAELVSLDKTHSHAAAAICATAQAQTHTEVRQVQADKTHIEQVKNDLSVLGDSLSNAVTNAKLTINTKAHTTEQHIINVGAQVSAHADNTKADITRTAQQFDANTAKRASSTEQYAHSAIRANNNVTITHDQVVQTAQQVSDDVAQLTTLKNSATNAQQQTERHSAQTSLDALHSKASAALCALSINTLAQQNAKLNTALNAALNNTLTAQQINQLFSV
ncbi:hypothetical protein J8L98_22020 [Pseudoalteromonas sp. MMG013]|uniref:hypothetical protein n=1 Tax=Pseudoalteromonas sp. MMG013 TaxID=2822687 RepID=UPI001B39932C|nr:hypothetical protein [Pseudoalteromonas sp. MMG013]MBQ4864372.1 hypothetical protein [Pseudoalteromonas sp. MMG013]